MSEEAIQLAKESVKEVLEPVTGLLRRLLGPAANEVGVALQDSVRVWRLKRQVRLLQDFERVVADRGLKLRPVALNVLFPILEGATLQEDEYLHAQWVALLTNAATSDDVPPSFPEILKQLTPIEARFLETAYEEALAKDGEEVSTVFGVKEPAISTNLFSSITAVHIQNLERLLLIRLSTNEIPFRTPIPPAAYFYVTQFGRAFVKACRLP